MIHHSIFKNWINHHLEFGYHDGLQVLIIQQFMDQFLYVLNNPKKKKNQIIISLPGDDNLDILTEFQIYIAQFGYTQSHLKVCPRSEKLIITI